MVIAFNRLILSGDAMSFVIGVFLFVVVIGILDARLPWPSPRERTP